MAKIKATIPTVVVLEQRIEDSFAVNIADFIARTAERRIAVIKNRRYVVTTVGVLIFSFLALFLSYGYLKGSNLNLATLYLFTLSVAAIFFNFQWYREQRVLAQELNMALIPTMTECFDRLTMYTCDEVHGAETKAILHDSGLLPEKYTYITTDDMFSFYEPYPVTVREIAVQQRRSSGRNTNTKEVFHGVLVEVVLDKTLEGTTYISTEGDVFGLMHQNFWGMRVAETGMVETELEWNEFEKDLHILSNNPIEARTILTPNFMVDLHEWWKVSGENIRIAFKGNKMYMLLPDNRVKIQTSTTSIDPEDIKTYAKSVIKPLWRVLLLVEDVTL